MAATEAMGVTLRAEFRDFEKALLKARNETDTKLAAIGRDFEKANAKMKAEAKAMAGSTGGLQGAFTGLSAGIGKLGAAGAAAAVGLGGLVVAFQGLKTATQFADDLGATADRIGVTAEALQELRYAADETDVPLNELESGLEALNATLGAFKTGIGSGRVTPVFEALGLTQADLANVENAGDLLPIIADRLAAVGDRAAQVQLAKKLGIEALLPMLRQGAGGIGEMRNEARDLGLVLSNDVVNGLSETNRQLERNQQAIDANVREMQSSLAPFFVWATGELAKLSRGITSLFSQMGAVENRADRTLADQEAALTRRIDDAESRRRRGVDGGRQSAVVRGWIREREAVRAERRRRASQVTEQPRASDRPGMVETASAPPSSGGSRARSGGSAPAADLTQQREIFELTQSIEAMRARGRDAEARAAQMTLDTLQLTARYEAVGIENASERAAAHVQELAAAEDAARRMVAIREKMEVITQDLVERERARLSALVDQARWEEEIAMRRGDPAVIEAASRELFIAQRINELLEERAGLITEAQARQQATGEWDALDAASREGDLRQTVHDAFRDGMDAAFSGDGKSLLEGLADAFAERLKSRLADTLTDQFMALLNGPKGGGAGSVSSLLKALPGFKTGGSFKVGGSGGLDSQTVAFRATPGEMVDIRKPGQMTGGAALNFDLRGAVMTTDLLKQMQQMAAQSGGLAFTAARKAVPADMARASRYSLP